MVKIGIVASDTNAIQWVKHIKNVDGFELTGWNDSGCDITKYVNSSGIIAYPSIEALFNYVDAVVVSCQMENAVYTISKCLKHFKHVFLAEAHHLKYNDFNYFLKIAEESNVKVYPEIGSLGSELYENSSIDCSNIQFVELNHTFPLSEGLCIGGRLFQPLLRDIDFVTHFIRANVKRIDAKGWGFCEPGTGMLHAKIDFDNGSTANFLLANSLKSPCIKVVIYGKTETVRINSSALSFKITRESLLKGVNSCEEFSYATESSLSKQFELFLSSIRQEQAGIAAMNRKYQSIRITHLIREKINQISAIHAFYS